MLQRKNTVIAVYNKDREEILLNFFLVLVAIFE